MSTLAIADLPATPRPMFVREPVPVVSPGTPADAGSGAERSQLDTALRANPLFRRVPSAIVDTLVARADIVDALPHQIVIREGAREDWAIVILSGRIGVRGRDPGSGLEFLLVEFGPGELVGEIEMLTGRTRLANCVALEPTRCAVIRGGDIQEAFRRSPEASFTLATVLAERLGDASRRTGIYFLNMARTPLDLDVVLSLPWAVINQHHVIPIALRDRRLTLAMTNPMNVVAVDDVRRIMRDVYIEPVAITEEDFRRFAKVDYPRMVRKRAQTATPQTAGASAIVVTSADALTEAAESNRYRIDYGSLRGTPTKPTPVDAPLIRLVDAIIGQAYSTGASDIHVEPQAEDLIVRFRIDGVMQAVQRLPKDMHAAIVSRLKVVSRIDITEKRLPQDGRIDAVLNDAPVHLRVSTVPAKHGEKVCLRILDKSSDTLSLSRMVTHEPTLLRIREMFSQLHGVVYVTGPTGSGKTTTLYGALAEINTPGINIVTVEDPIEYELPGITQIQTHSDIGLDFARILRAFLRQDPDVLLVGETRDEETAKATVEAALTGHMVFTSLHTNSAATAFTRLREMGIEPFLASASTMGVIAQRLARRLCLACREEYPVDKVSARFFDLAEGTSLWRARGCAACGGRGMKGRVALYEVLAVTPSLREIIGRGGRAEEIHEAALAEGMIDLKHYAGLLLREGLTSVEEVASVVALA